MRVRIAKNGDEAAIRTLLQGVHASFGEALAPRDGLERLLEEALAGDGQLEFLVAHEDAGDTEGLIGLISVTLGRTTQGASTFAWIDDLFVAPAARRQGVGLALLQAAVERGRERGAVEVRLSADMGDAALIRLHRRAGFVSRGQVLMLHDLSAMKSEP